MLMILFFLNKKKKKRLFVSKYILEKDIMSNSWHPETR